MQSTQANEGDADAKKQKAYSVLLVVLQFTTSSTVSDASKLISYSLTQIATKTLLDPSLSHGVTYNELLSHCRYRTIGALKQ